MKLLHARATRLALLRAIGVLAALGAGARDDRVCPESHPVRAGRRFL